LVVGAFCIALPAAAADLARRVVIVANDNEPSSLPLAEHYAQQRGIPTNQICRLQARAAETITRREYREQIREPVLRFLTQNRWLVQAPRPGSGGLPDVATIDSRVSILVLMYGVPLRIEADASLTEPAAASHPKEMQRNESSVDSELALLPTFGLLASGALRNPFFGSTAPFGAALDRRMLLVGRLDGPDPATVRRLIDDAVATEKVGLLGRAYFDTQASKNAGYAQGDNWIKAARESFRQAGYETELDDAPATFGTDFPMTDAAIYAGWYATHAVGPFRREGFQFRPGAVAYHIHSSSASSLRTRTSYWAGPLLDRGAAATMGNVFEPYLAMSPHVDVFFQRLLEQFTFIEAAYASQPVLSWQTTFVGDPLYRPFAVALDDQLARLKDQPAAEWVYLRKANLLALRGRQADAIALCREHAGKSAVLREKLGDLLEPAGAIEAYRELLEQGGNLRVSRKLAKAYESNQQPGQALAVYEGLIRAHPQHSSLEEFCRRARDLAKAAGEPAKAAALQQRLDEMASARSTPKK
jgi:uncharacterized protein (TIGR03790 family)